MKSGPSIVRMSRLEYNPVNVHVPQECLPVSLQEVRGEGPGGVRGWTRLHDNWSQQWHWESHCHGHRQEG